MSMAEHSIFDHPRFKHYPHHLDYYDMRQSPRPFVMHINSPNFNSASVNTDALGFREHFDQDGKFVDWRTYRDTFERCNVVVGGSTVFGVDATDDQKTMTHLLSTEFSPYEDSERLPFLNFGLRAATSMQELMLFMLNMQSLPKIENVILFSGVNNACLCVMPELFFNENSRPMFAEDQLYYSNMEAYRKLEMGRDRLRILKFHDWLDNQFHRKKFLRKLLQLFQGPMGPRDRMLNTDRSKRMEIVSEYFAQELQIWSTLSAGMGFKLIYVMQPCIGWNNRPLEPIEKELYEEDLRWVSSMSEYTNQTFYSDFKSRTEHACARAGVPFYDSNDYIGQSIGVGKEIFTDVCHLTDAGYADMASYLRDLLKVVR